METSDLKDLFSLTTRVLADKLPVRYYEYGTGTIPLYGFTQTDDNRPSVIETCWKTYASRSHRFRLYFLDDQDATNRGYSGYPSWMASAVKMHVPTGHIESVPHHTPLNTLSEAISLVHHAVTNGWLDLVIVAPPFHMVRAFMSVITAIANSRYEGAPNIKVYCAVGATLPWGEEVAHSQGTLRETRAGLIGTELDRILKYQDSASSKPFPLVQFRTCLDYLDRRGD